MATYERHNGRARDRVKDALLSLMESKRFADISVSELAKAAEMSRSTFYAHFPNTRAVFDEALRDFHTDNVMPLRERLHCAGCEPRAAKRPFCEAVRDAGKYQPLVNDPSYFSAVMDRLLEEDGERSLLDDYRKMGLSEREARAVAVFQLSGCYAAATDPQADGDWAEGQRIIDAFVRGGVQALRTR